MTVDSSGDITVYGIEALDGAFMSEAIRAQINSTESSDGIAVTISDGVLSSLGTRSRTVFARHDGKGPITITLGSAADDDGPTVLSLDEGVVSWLIDFDAGTSAAPSKSRNIVKFASGKIDARSIGIDAYVGGKGDYHGAPDSPMIHVASSGDIRAGKEAGVAALTMMATKLLDVDENGVLTEAEKGIRTAIVGRTETAPATDNIDALLTALSGDKYNDFYDKTANNLYESAKIFADSAEDSRTVLINHFDSVFGYFVATGIYAGALDLEAIANVIDLVPDDGEPGTDGELADDANEAADNEIEKKVLYAVISGATEISDALFGEFTDANYKLADYKTKVRETPDQIQRGRHPGGREWWNDCSDGYGVFAEFVRFDNRNGAIHVSVAQGASVTGTNNYGIDVRFAGLDNKGTADNESDDVRKQSVSVSGIVVGGEGGVRLNGGGSVTVGETGDISGGKFGVIITDRVDDDNLFGLGSGNIKVSSSGTIKATDGTGILIRNRGTGSATVDVLGGTVSGTAHGILIEGTTATTTNENVLAQRVTVHGTVSGGIKLVGGGTVIIGKTERSRWKMGRQYSWKMLLWARKRLIRSS